MTQESRPQGAASESSLGWQAGQRQDTAAQRQPPCRPGCALSCPTTAWAHLLDDSSPSPAQWRLAWTLIGLPDPLPEREWADAIAAVADTYGRREALEALRIASTYPTCRGWGQAQRTRASALLAVLQREQVAA